MSFSVTSAGVSSPCECKHLGVPPLAIHTSASGDSSQQAATSLPCSPGCTTPHPLQELLGSLQCNLHLASLIALWPPSQNSSWPYKQYYEQYPGGSEHSEQSFQISVKRLSHSSKHKSQSEPGSSLHWLQDSPRSSAAAAGLSLPCGQRS